MNQPPLTESSSRDATSLPTRLECRPNKGAWITAAFLFFTGSLPLAQDFSSHPFNPAHRESSLFACAIFYLPLLLLLWWMKRARIVADTEGLRWRSMGGWKSATWPQVTNYGLVAGSRRSRSYRLVETIQSRLLFDGNLDVPSKFFDFVEEHAQWAKARGWHVLGTDFAEKERVFVYRPRSPLKTWTPILLLLAVGLLMAVGLLQQRHAALPPQSLSEWLEVLAPALLLPLMLGPLALIGVLSDLKQARAVRERQEQRIFADQDGLTFEYAHHFQRVRWHEITDYYRAPLTPHTLSPLRCVIVTASGTFDFVGIEKGAQLCALVQRYATKAKCSHWRRTPDMEVLTSEAAQWSGGQPDAGQHIFRYRTRANRALLIFFTFMALFVPVAPTIVHALTGEYLGTLNPLTVFMLAALFGLPALCGWYFYWYVSLRTDGRGIEKRNPFTTRFIGWAEVREFAFESSTPLPRLIVRGNGTIKISALLANADALRAEITRYTGVECKGHPLHTASPSLPPHSEHE